MINVKPDYGKPLHLFLFYYFFILHAACVNLKKNYVIFIWHGPKHVSTLTFSKIIIKPSNLGQEAWNAT